MDRTVPRTGSEEIELYMRTYYSLLRSTETIQIETLVESHMAMESSLHIDARNIKPDVAALTYSSLRLPAAVAQVDQILVGQIEKTFADAGYPDVATWELVPSPGRRRRIHFDGDSTLAVFIASRSDIDDLVPMLTAYQIEWNKLHVLLQNEAARLFITQNADRPDGKPLSDGEVTLLAGVLQVDAEDLRRLELVWQPDFVPVLRAMARSRKSFGLRLLTGSLADYRRATSHWWAEVESEALSRGVDPEQRPVYFVSSNTHSIPNLLTGYAWRHEADLMAFVEAKGHEDLLAEYRAIQDEDRAANLQNFLYYVQKKYLSDTKTGALQLETDEAATGIYRVPNRHGFQIAAQVIEIGKLKPEWIDPRLCEDIDYSSLADSDALIVNIDYPLGLAAYEILARITESVGHLLGVYVMGKAATLNGRIGDVMISNVVHDEHSQNSYLFDNCFAAQSVVPYLTYGTVLDNQKAISTPGTFLQNSTYMSVFYHEGYTVIEMEAGPYLSAIYEAYRPKRHPQNEIVNLYGVPFDIGCLHYASDTPMSKGHNLGSRNLSYQGVDPTYATAVAIMRRILDCEVKRIGLRSRIKADQPAV